METFKGFISILLKPVWTWVLVGPPFFYGWFALVRDEFMAPEVAQRLRLGGLLGRIPWDVWLMMAVVIWACSVAWEAAKVRAISKRDALSPISVPLRIAAQEKEMGGEPYILITITNEYRSRVDCRIEVHEILDKSGKDIRREISQFANHFSWAGGGAASDGSKPIEAGLDATVNIAVLRRYAVGFYWLFHEDPKANWQVPGRYIVTLGVRGRAGDSDIVGQNLLVELEYVERMDSDGEGGYRNNGQLKLCRAQLVKQRGEL